MTNLKGFPEQMEGFEYRKRDLQEYWTLNIKI